MFLGKVRPVEAQSRRVLNRIVNEILGDHNVDKQMTDSRGDVRTLPFVGESN